MAEAFVRTLKRDYALVNPRPDAQTVIKQLPTWLAYYNEVHAHRALGYRSPREYIAQTREAPSGIQGATTPGRGLSLALFTARWSRSCLADEDIFVLVSYPLPPNSERQSAGAATWIDLIDPTAEEVGIVRDRYGITVPDRAALEEIEATSRMHAEGDKLYLSAPLIAHATEDFWEVAPTGFVLTPRVCITIRYHALDAFDAVIAEIGQTPDLTPAETLVNLLEEIVDRAADHLEQISRRVTEASRSVFFGEQTKRHLSKDTAALQNIVRQIGQASDQGFRIRELFLSLSRMVVFIRDKFDGVSKVSIDPRLELVLHDLKSLEDFEGSLSSRIQMIQNAASGFISIAQNNVFKVLTIATVVGIPPVLVVGIYGMNFEHMPELAWPYGYPLSLLGCLVSAAVPLIWFKWKNWL